MRNVYARVRQKVNLILHVNHDDKKVDVQDEGGGDLDLVKKRTKTYGKLQQQTSSTYFARSSCTTVFFSLSSRASVHLL